MTFYQFSLWKKDGKFYTSEIINKETGSTLPFTLNDKVSILEWYDQNIGKTLLFISSDQNVLQAFYQGLELGLFKSDTLL